MAFQAKRFNDYVKNNTFKFNILLIITNLFLKCYYLNTLYKFLVKINNMLNKLYLTYLGHTICRK